MSPRDRLALTAALTFSVAAAIYLVASHLFHRAAAEDQYVVHENPLFTTTDGNRANVVIVDRQQRIIGLAATGVVRRSPMAPIHRTPDGWVAYVEAANRKVVLPLTGSGPALVVAVLDAPLVRIKLSEEEYQRLVSAIESEDISRDVDAPLDAKSVVDVIRDNYDGKDLAQLQSALDRYKLIILSNEERKSIDRTLRSPFPDAPREKQ